MPKPVRRVEKPAYRKKPKRKPFKSKKSWKGKPHCIACGDTGRTSKGGPCICVVRGEG